MKLIQIFYIVLAALLVSYSSPLLAQDTSERQWCSPARAQDGGEVCSGSASTTCVMQNESFNPNGGVANAGVEPRFPDVTRCLTKDINFDAGHVGIRVNLASAFLMCPTGTKPYGGSCLPDVYEDTDTCNAQGGTGGSSGSGGSGGDGWGCGGTSGGPNLTVNSGGGVGISVGNPINVTTGAKVHSVTDWSSSDGRLKVSRKYNSLAYGANYFFNENQSVGEKWTLNQMPRLRFDLDMFGNQFGFIHPSGRYVLFGCCDAGTTFRDAKVPLAGGGYEIYKIDVTHSNSQGSFINGPTSIRITDPKGTIFRFTTTVETSDLGTEHVAYKPFSIEYTDGYRIDYTASLFMEELYNNGRRYLPVISAATDNLGRSLGFEHNIRRYDSCDLEAPLADPTYCTAPRFPLDRAAQLGNVSRIDLPDGTSLHYSYEGGTAWEDTLIVDRRLKRVSHLDANDVEIWSEAYIYEDARDPYALTGVIDAKGTRISIYSYDDFGRAISSQRVGGVGRVDLEYEPIPNSTTLWNHKVTNAFGREVNYEVQKGRLSGRYQIQKAESVATADAPADISSVDYSPLNGGGGYFVSSMTDRKGRVTTYDYDDAGHRISKVMAAGTADETTMTAVWDLETRLKSQTTVEGLTIDYVRDTAGRVTQMTQTDTTLAASAQRQVAFTYDGPNLTSIDGPLAGPSDSVTYEWIGARLQRTTNALGHVTEFFDHNLYDAPTRIVDPNGVTSLISYDARQRPISLIVDAGGRDAATDIEYDLNGQVTKVTSPDGVTLEFTYDAAQRLKEIVNSAGERVVLTRNAMSTVTQTDISDSSGSLTAEISRVTDALNRVVETTVPPTQAGLSSITQQSYDEMDNPIEMTDPREELWQSNYDNLDRLVGEIDPLGAETDYDLKNINDARDPLSKVTDVRNVETTYVRNGFGEVISEISFEAGTSSYDYDTRGLITSMTDARGVIVNYSYDVAGRLLSEDYEGSQIDDVTYEYDQGAFGIGQLTAITEGFGRTEYTYDALGFMTSETRIIDGQTYITHYTYDLAGNMLTTTYPSGLTIICTRDNLSRITDIVMVAADGTSTNLLSNTTYRPYGGVTQASYGDGHTLDVTYDTADRVIGLTRSSNQGALMDLGFVHDAQGDILSIEDSLRPERSQSFTYDPVSRLTSATGGYGEINYGYNLGGDRTYRDWFGADGTLNAAERYEYEDATARLLTVSTEDAGGNLTPIREFDYHASGQVSTDLRGANEYLYGLNDRGRLTTVTRNGAEVAAYIHDTSEQRIAKTANGVTVHYHYDLDGRLISETDGATGETLREYVWLGLMPIAVISAGDEATESSPGCTDEEKAALEDSLAEREAELVTLADLEGRVTDAIEQSEAVLTSLQTTRDELAAQLDALPNRRRFRRFRLRRLIAVYDFYIDIYTDYIQRLETFVGQIDARTAEVEAEITDINDQITACATGGETEDTAPQLAYLHADHLGRPQFATDITGAVIWDMGEGVTPFGDSVNLAGAFAQRLMFPGQYADVETNADGDNVTLSHNWHRTYDPTLGRYLQSDPIGLAGGLNRYAYVGGNPVGAVDPRGEYGIVGGLFGGGIELGLELAMNGGRLECVNWARVGLGAAAGAIGVPAFMTRGFQFSKYSKSARNVNRRYRRYLDGKGRAPKAEYEIHHAHIPVSGKGPFGKIDRATDGWRNHPMNLKPLQKEHHRRLTGSWNGKLKFGPLGQWWYGSTQWSKVASASLGAGIAAETMDDDCGC